jgi:hypothetical protein
LSHIPPAEYVVEDFDGALVDYQGHRALVSNALLPLPSIAGLKQMAAGQLIVRYGVRYLGKLHLSIVPGLIASERGTMLVGSEAWEFLIHKSARFPRAEVFGYRNDGAQDSMFIRDLDVVAPIEALVYPNNDTTTPIGNFSVLVVPPNLPLPHYLDEYLTRYAAVADWIAHV